MIWHPAASSYSPKLNWNWKDAGLIPLRRSRTIAEIDWHSNSKGLPGSVPKIQETAGPVSTCGRELLRGWWRPTCLMVSFIVFTSSVRDILNTSSYSSCYFIDNLIWSTEVHTQNILEMQASEFEVGGINSFEHVYQVNIYQTSWAHVNPAVYSEFMD
jgi:hypothetical protein